MREYIKEDEGVKKGRCRNTARKMQEYRKVGEGIEGRCRNTEMKNEGTLKGRCRNTKRKMKKYRKEDEGEQK